MRTVNNHTQAEMVPDTVFGSAEVNLLRPNTAYCFYNANDSAVLGIWAVYVKVKSISSLSTDQKILSQNVISRALTHNLLRLAWQ